MGKGDTPRPVDKKVYDDNFERAFGKRKIKVWEDAPGREPEAGPDDRQADGVVENPGSQTDPSDHEAVEGEEEV